MTLIDKCGVFGSTDFLPLWSLRNFPLTEMLGPFNSDISGYDLDLVVSMPHGHVQLGRRLDPLTLYAPSNYQYRTSATIERGGTHFFETFVKDFVGGQRFNSLVDIGGNDLAVARNLSYLAERVTVVDPVCEPEHGQRVDGVHVVGRSIESVELNREEYQPDIVICRHTMEHLASPSDVISQLMSQSKKNCLFFIEVPDLESLLESLRLDAVFHQHLHYFDLWSISAMISMCGGEVLEHRYNRAGPCGGSLAVVFRSSTSHDQNLKFIRPNVGSFVDGIQRRVRQFRNQMDLMAELLNELPKPVYGYGASLMLSSLAFHLGTGFEMLHCVLDDDETKDGLTYQNVPVSVSWTGNESVPAEASFVVTSLENVRPIFQRICSLQPRRIVVPICN